MRNHAAWRANVRKSYKDQTSNPQHRGAWGNTNVYALFSSYAGAWPFFGPLGKVNFSITETYSELYTISTVTTRPATDPVTLSDEFDFSLLFEADVARKDVTYKDYQIEPLPGTPSETDTCVRTHGSATPYGEGLYDMAGSFQIDGQLLRIEYQHRGTSDDYEGTETINERSRRIIQYRTKQQVLDGVLQNPQIKGMETRVRITLPQFYHGPSYVQAPIGAPGPPIPMMPFEKNPDGEDLDGLAVEMYFTDRTAKILNAGAWKDEMDRISGGGGDSWDELDDDGYTVTTSYDDSFVRSGVVELSIIP